MVAADYGSLGKVLLSVVNKKDFSFSRNVGSDSFGNPVQSLIAEPKKKFRRYF